MRIDDLTESTGAAVETIRFYEREGLIPAAQRTDNGARRETDPARDAPGLFPPELVIEIKALACEIPAKLGLPLSRSSFNDIALPAQYSGLVARR